MNTKKSVTMKYIYKRLIVIVFNVLFTFYYFLLHELLGYVNMYLYSLLHNVHPGTTARTTTAGAVLHAHEDTLAGLGWCVKPAGGDRNGR